MKDKKKKKKNFCIERQNQVEGMIQNLKFTERNLSELENKNKTVTQVDGDKRKGPPSK